MAASNRGVRGVERLTTCVDTKADKGKENSMKAEMLHMQ